MSIDTQICHVKCAWFPELVVRASILPGITADKFLVGLEIPEQWYRGLTGNHSTKIYLGGECRIFRREGGSLSSFRHVSVALRPITDKNKCEILCGNYPLDAKKHAFMELICCRTRLFSHRDVELTIRCRRTLADEEKAFSRVKKYKNNWLWSSIKQNEIPFRPKKRPKNSHELTKITWNCYVISAWLPGNIIKTTVLSGLTVESFLRSLHIPETWYYGLTGNRPTRIFVGGECRVLRRGKASSPFQNVSICLRSITNENKYVILPNNFPMDSMKHAFVELVCSQTSLFSRRKVDLNLCDRQLQTDEKLAFSKVQKYGRKWLKSAIVNVENGVLQPKKSVQENWEAEIKDLDLLQVKLQLQPDREQQLIGQVERLKYLLKKKNQKNNKKLSKKGRGNTANKRKRKDKDIRDKRLGKNVDLHVSRRKYTNSEPPLKAWDTEKGIQRENMLEKRKREVKRLRGKRSGKNIDIYRSRHKYLGNESSSESSDIESLANEMSLSQQEALWSEEESTHSSDEHNSRKEKFDRRKKAYHSWLREYRRHKIVNFKDKTDIDTRSDDFDSQASEEVEISSNEDDSTTDKESLEMSDLCDNPHEEGNASGGQSNCSGSIEMVNESSSAASASFDSNEERSSDEGSNEQANYRDDLAALNSINEPSEYEESSNSEEEEPHSSSTEEDLTIKDEESLDYSDESNEDYNDKEISANQLDYDSPIGSEDKSVTIDCINSGSNEEQSREGSRCDFSNNSDDDAASAVSSRYIEHTSEEKLSQSSDESDPNEVDGNEHDHNGEDPSHISDLVRYKSRVDRKNNNPEISSEDMISRKESREFTREDENKNHKRRGAGTFTSQERSKMHRDVSPGKRSTPSINKYDEHKVNNSEAQNQNSIHNPSNDHLKKNLPNEKESESEVFHRNKVKTPKNEKSSLQPEKDTLGGIESVHTTSAENNRKKGFDENLSNHKSSHKKNNLPGKSYKTPPDLKKEQPCTKYPDHQASKESKNVEYRKGKKSLSKEDMINSVKLLPTEDKTEREARDYHQANSRKTETDDFISDIKFDAQSNGKNEMLKDLNVVKKECASNKDDKPEMQIYLPSARKATQVSLKNPQHGDNNNFNCSKNNCIEKQLPPLKPHKIQFKQDESNKVWSDTGSEDSSNESSSSTSSSSDSSSSSSDSSTDSSSSSGITSSESDSDSLDLKDDLNRIQIIEKKNKQNQFSNLVKKDILQTKQSEEYIYKTPNQQVKTKKEDPNNIRKLQNSSQRKPLLSSQKNIMIRRAESARTKPGK